MIKGVSEICVARTQGDEWGVYRITKESYVFLLFSFDDRDEALVRGEALAEMLGVVFHSDKPRHDVKREELPRKRVSHLVGAMNIARGLRSQGKSPSEIRGIMTEKYIEIGRDEEKAKQLAADIIWYLDRE